jgi:hypothetical protein
MIMTSDEEPQLVEIKSIKLHNPERKKDEHIEKIDIEGDNLAESEYIEERHEAGYITRGLTAQVYYKGDFFNIAFSGSDMMGYAKVEEIPDYSKAEELMDILRERYLENFREL